MHGFLMIVSAKHEVDTDLRERTEHLPRVLEPVSSGQLALHRIVMHDDDTSSVLRRALELLARTIDLPAGRIQPGDDYAKFQQFTRDADTALEREIALGK